MSTDSIGERENCELLNIIFPSREEGELFETLVNPIFGVRNSKNFVVISIDPSKCRLVKDSTSTHNSSICKPDMWGTGHADLTRFEWAVNINRDSYASYIGHHPMLAYMAIAENESIGRERYNFMQKMLLPCGLPPERRRLKCDNNIHREIFIKNPALCLNFP